MAKRSEKRTVELQRKYGNDAFTPIHPKYIEQARQLSARYILFVNKDNKHGVCEKCMKDVEFERTKHKEKMTCPNCGTELTIMHTWRRKCDWNVDWNVVGEVIDDNIFALRYIEVEQKKDFTKVISEKAREIYDFKHGWRYRFSNLNWYNDLENGQNDCWSENNYYFIEFNMYHRRKTFCIASNSLNNIEAELRKIKALQYFDKTGEYLRRYWYPSNAIKKLMSAPLYEKLEKVGLNKIIESDFGEWRASIKYKRSETSLTKMLGINKAQYRVLLKDGTISTLDFIRSNTEMPIEMLDYIVTNHDIYRYQALNDIKDQKKRLKALKYLTKRNVNANEYIHYLSLLKKLNYDMTDESYIYPKDFGKADERVANEYLAISNPEAYKARQKQNGLIKKISDGLRKMEDLQEFLNGSNGLLVYVPESVEDLRAEGRNLHNCIGTYSDRIAEGKTLVFFVRRLNDPTAPFVAFEYVNGDVVQCRADNNEDVKDDKIISFVDAFAERLRKNNVLYKAA